MRTTAWISTNSGFRDDYEEAFISILEVVLGEETALYAFDKDVDELDVHFLNPVRDWTRNNDGHCDEVFEFAAVFT